MDRSINILLEGLSMISLTRINGKVFVLNSELIEVLEETPDTVITLTNGNRYVVSETVDEIVDKIVKYKKKVFHLAVNNPDDGNGV